MRKVTVSTYITLDGVIQPLDWSFKESKLEAQKERGAYARELIFSADALLLGRETFEIFAEVWPTRGAADDGPGEAGVSDRINSMPKYVASTTLSDPLPWNSTLLKGDTATAVKTLKEGSGGDILIYGCGELARTLTEHNLIDEYLFWVYPVVRGQGTRPFGSDFTADLELVDTRQFGAGFSVLTCRPTAGM